MQKLLKMLDNIVTENCMAAMPIEILADAKDSHNHKSHCEDKTQTTATTNTIEQCAAAAAPVIKTNKTKTILNWLKNTTSSNSTTLNKNNNNNNNTNHINSIKTNSVVSDNNQTNACNHNRVDKIIQEQQQQTQISTDTNCTCPTLKQQNNTSSQRATTTTTPPTKSLGHKDDDTLREFRGVQTLKHFWNKRITANRESALKAKSSKQQQFTKSVGCLVNAINSTGEPPPPSTSTTSSSSPPPLSEKELLKARKLRALSLHDCSRDSPDFDEISLSDIDIQKHLEKDNFYKYKTAEQASKLRELSEHSTQKKLSNGIILAGGQKPERFDWLKRHDKFSRKKSVELTLSTALINNTIKTDNSNQHIADTSAAINNDIIINEHKMQTQQQHQHKPRDRPVSLPTAIGQNMTEVGNVNHSSETSTPTLTAANTPQHAVSRRRLTTRKDSPKTLVSASSISRESSTASLAASPNSHKTVVKRNSSARKYSFKTHTRSYHVPRKMHTNKDAASGGTGVAANAPNSLVAKLTQQFNEIIQKDKTLLEEIKRKNGVLMTHKGHVYKVVNTSSLNRNQSPSVSRASSRVQDGNTQATGTSTVQKNIKKFESESRGLKPKVPLKSIQVLRKSNELVINKTIVTSRINPNRLNNKTETETKTKTEIKPQTLALPSTLEMVQEEAKTPVENKELQNEDNNFKSEKSEAAISPKENGANKDNPNLTKVEETCKDNELMGKLSSEEPSNQDEFLTVRPSKIESVIYKSIHKNKQKNTETPKIKETPKDLKDNTIPLNEEKSPIKHVTEEISTKVQEQNAEQKTETSIIENTANIQEESDESIPNNGPDKQTKSSLNESATSSNEEIETRENDRSLSEKRPDMKL